MRTRNRPYEKFFDVAVQSVLDTRTRILDIGGGLRLSKDHSNRLDTSRAWIRDAIQDKKIEYVVLDAVDTYNPHLVGDIQALPLPDDSEEAIFCLSVLEHVENPFKAADELHRVLAPGGTCVLHVPFLYYYHAEKGYYGDFWRFTEDSLRLLFKPFSGFEIQNVRGPLETLIHLSPLGRIGFFCDAAFAIDRMSGKSNSRQTSGYYLVLTK